jgi:ABC-type lipoprotein export system ATPase subunit
MFEKAGLYCLCVKALSQTLPIVTHDQEFAKATDRTIEMEDEKKNSFYFSEGINSFYPSIG